MNLHSVRLPDTILLVVGAEPRSSSWQLRATRTSRFVGNCFTVKFVYSRWDCSPTFETLALFAIVWIRGILLQREICVFTLKPLSYVLDTSERKCLDSWDSASTWKLSIHDEVVSFVLAIYPGSHTGRSRSSSLLRSGITYSIEFARSTWWFLPSPKAQNERIFSLVWPCFDRLIFMWISNSTPFLLLLALQAVKWLPRISATKALKLTQTPASFNPIPRPLCFFSCPRLLPRPIPHCLAIRS